MSKFDSILGADWVYSGLTPREHVQFHEALTFGPQIEGIQLGYWDKARELHIARGALKKIQEPKTSESNNFFSKIAILAMGAFGSVGLLAFNSFAGFLPLGLFALRNVAKWQWSNPVNPIHVKEREKFAKNMFDQTFARFK